MLEMINEAFSLVVALGLGLYALPHMNRFFRFMYLQLLVWIGFYVLAQIVPLYQEANHLEQNNQWVLNLHMLLEATLLMAAAYTSFGNVWSKRLAIVVFGGFLTVFTMQAYTQGIDRYFNFADVAESIGVSILFSLLLYAHFKQHALAWWHSPEILACLGVLVYFACSVPYIAMLHYLQERYPEANNILYYLISDILANVRYLCLAIAFWLVRRNALLLKRIK